MLLALVVATALRFATLGEQSFWSDELFTVQTIGMDPFGQLDRLAVMESTPPLYYWMAWAWSKVFGVGEYALRSLSALAGLATVVVLFALTNRLSANAKASVAAALLASVSPFLVWYSQEARSYSLFGLLAALSLLLALRAREDPTPGRFLMWSLSAALALATDYFAAFLVVAELGLLARASRTGRRAGLFLLAPLAVAAVALLPLFLQQTEVTASDGDAGGAVHRLSRLPLHFTAGYGGSTLQIVAAAMACLALAALVLMALRTSRAARPLALGLLACAAAALVFVPSLNARSMIWLLLGTLVLAAMGTVRRGGLPVAAVVVLASLATVIAVAMTPGLQRTDLRSAGLVLSRPGKTPRLVVVYDYRGGQPLDHYLRGGVFRPARGAILVREITVLGLALDSLNQDVPPASRIALRPPPAGFALVASEARDTFTFLTYRASEGRLVPATELAAALAPGLRAQLVLQIR